MNSTQQDFGAAFYKEQIVYTSSGGKPKAVKSVYNWNKKTFLDLYVADNDNGQLKNPKSLHKKYNRKMHEGPASFTADGNTMAFTRNNYKSRSKDGVVHLEIYFAQKDAEGKWDNPVAFKLNNTEYSVGHPCLSADGNTMYFASEMPGGMGGVNLYRIRKNADGTWGEAENLGEHINTEGNEMFPFFHEEKGWLFFASNGHFGLGGLDIF